MAPFAAYAQFAETAAPHCCACRYPQIPKRARATPVSATYASLFTIIKQLLCECIACSTQQDAKGWTCLCMSE